MKLRRMRWRFFGLLASFKRVKVIRMLFCGAICYFVTARKVEKAVKQYYFQLGRRFSIALENNTKFLPPGPDK